MLICPVCGLPLSRDGRAFRCAKNHSYDLATQGYLYLLPSNKKSSPNPGDNREMVQGRTRFLDSESYRPLSDALSETVCALCGEHPQVLDLGCGEGYYTTQLWNALQAAGKHPSLYGVDLSKAAVRHAAVRCKGAQFAVASLFELPIATERIDCCYNVFSPICAKEFTRVLKPDGHFVAVYPAARHLFGLKEILYDEPYENPEKDFLLDGLEIVNRQRLHYRFTLEGNTLIESLFSMTPYYYKTPVEGAKRLAACEHLETEADFWLITYRR